MNFLTTFKKALTLTGVLTGCLLAATSYGQQSGLREFPLTAVTLHDSPFYRAEQTDLNYILALDPDRLLAPFLKDAGLPAKESYGNWENTGLDGHIGGHYLTALALMHASTGNEEVKRRLDYMINRLAACQEKNGNGYVGGIPDGKKVWDEIAAGNIRAQSFSLNNKWVPLYNIHKLFAGLRDAYLIGENEQALDVLVKLSDWFIHTTSNLSDEQIQQMLRSEHGGLNEVFADVSSITGEKKYIDMAIRLSDRRILDPLLAHKDQLTGMHANTQIPKVIGYQRIAGLTNNTDWANASAFFWNTVVENRSIAIGGNSVREHFNPVNDFSSMIESNQGPETCNSYNMLRLTKDLFLSKPEASYMDYYERTLFNHILSSQHPDGGFVYFTPMRPMHYRVYSQPDQGFWCCVGSGIENHGKYGEMIYAHDDTDVYVNLFIASTLSWKEKGMTIEQSTEFPFQQTSTLTITVDKPAKAGLQIRYPGWVASGALKISVNGKAQTIAASPSSYVRIFRKWKSGDVVTIETPMHTSLEYLPDGSKWAAFVHGPIVLAAETDSSELKGLFADDSRMGHVASGKLYPIDEAPVILSSENIAGQLKPVKDRPLAFSAATLIEPEKYKHLTLIPFFEVHDARYMIYWQVTTPDELENLRRRIAERERQQEELNARTIDVVMSGEQQPEVEHGFNGEQTEAGYTDGQAWRSARGWFSYTLHDVQREGQAIRISYAGRVPNRKFEVIINDVLVKTIDSAAQQDGTVEEDITIPAELRKETITVKFQASEGSTTGQIYGVRLLKSEN